MAECSVRKYENGYQAGVCEKDKGECNMTIDSCSDMNQSVCKGFCVDDKCHYKRNVTYHRTLSGKRYNKKTSWELISYCKNSSKICVPSGCRGCARTDRSCVKYCTATCHGPETIEISLTIVPVIVACFALIATIAYCIRKRNKKR